MTTSSDPNNSNLVFDFPDPSPRFEFNDVGFGVGGGGGGGVGSTSASSGNIIKKGGGIRRFGVGGGGGKNKLLAKKKLIKSSISNVGSNGGDESPSKGSTGTSATAATTVSGSGSSSLNGSNLEASFGTFETTPRRSNVSPTRSRAGSGGGGGINCGDVAAGPCSDLRFDFSPRSRPRQQKQQQPSPSGHKGLKPLSLSKNGSEGSASLGLKNNNGGRLSSPSQSPRYPLHSKHARNVSSANSAYSGYVSEVSEFSFDRVTVTTNETGRSSNVSWAFVDDNLLNAGGCAVPYTAEGEEHDDAPPRRVPTTLSNDVAAAATTSGGTNDETNDNDRREPSSDQGRNQRRRHHRPRNSLEISVSEIDVSDDEMNAVPFSGIVNDSSNQSVISEISERTDGAPEGVDAVGEEDDADARVRAILKDGMANVRRKGSASISPPSASSEEAEEEEEERAAADDVISAVESRAKELAMLKHEGEAAALLEGGGKGKKGADSSPSRCTLSTAKSTPSGGASSSGTKSFLRDVKSNYAQFKTSRNDGRQEKSSILRGIFEDLQFCGLYFCGIDTTADGQDGGVDGPATGYYDERMKKKKEERKREMDNTFIGKVIQCGTKVPGCGGMCGAVEL